ncbi:MAG: fructose-6-phosphate aldolase [Caldiserica bacterium]|jgi:transaldolase|nr:fructose-6-phosphate aldolase [Caldisericota bacterium]MDH7562765.1 fructose-6-phosphate aldolase [Caldisericota bacterium]
MELFLDTANINEIREALGLGLISGVTTNPTLIAKEKVDFQERVREIAKLIYPGPVSVEVLAQDAEGMLKEAVEYSSWEPNIVIKVPIIKEGLKALKKIHEKGIKTNVTLVFSLNQALLAALSGATYVSPFVGRLDDVGHDGMELVSQISTVYNMYGFPTRIIAASIRHPLHVIQAASVGAHIATIPFSVLEGMIKHPLTEIGVKRFLDDYQKAKEFLEKK